MLASLALLTAIESATPTAQPSVPIIAVRWSSAIGGPNPPATIAPLTITADIQPAVNAALWQNQVPVLTGLRITAEPDAPPASVPCDITLDLTCEPPVIRPRLRHIQVLGVDLDGDMLAAITEAARASATFTATRRGTAERLGELRRDFRLLTHSE